MLMGNTKRAAKWSKIFGLLSAAVIVVAAFLLDPSARAGGSSDEVPVPPSAEMAQETATKLAAATAAHGICYGWILTGFDHTYSEGSNLGPSTRIDTTRCRQWVKVQAVVDYRRSPKRDTASFYINSSFSTEEPLAIEFARLGLSDKMLVDEPGWAVCQAALALPLLMNQNGVVKAVPAPAVTGTPAALPAAGNDFWRENYSYMLTTATFVALALIFFLIGWFDRRHRRATAPQ